MLSIQLKDFWTMAAKAVKAYANKKFAGFFQEADVEDIVAEVVTKMWRARERFDPDKGSEFGWVWTIAKNAVNDAAMAKRNRKDIGGGWDDGGYGAPQRAWKVSLASIQNGSAALGLLSGESTTTEFSVYPTTTIYVFPNANPGYTLDKIIWSYIDGTASYDITEAKNFVMPAMDVVVYVSFKPLGS